MRFVLAALLMLTVAPVWAKWVQVTETSSVVYYVDPASIRKEGDVRRIWALEERKKPGQGGEMSRKNQMEFDCKSQTSRIRFVSTYSAPMGSGQAIFSGRGTDKPHPVEPDSIEGRLLKRACSQ